MCQLPTFSHPNLLVGIETGDDAAVYKVDEDLAIVTTVDFFPPIVDDPFTFGEISAANALSDVYAMGAKPLFAMNIMAFPEDIPREIMYDILNGGAAKAKEAGILIVGGHTVKDKEPKYGLSVTGVVKPGSQITNAGANIGDVLVLTKSIGTGVITTAAKLGKVDKSVLAGAISVMQTLNDMSSEAMISVGVNACTDITGFGLLGHLNRMIKESNVAAKVSFQNVPILNGTLELINENIVPKGTHNNLKATDELIKWDHNIDESSKLLLCDAQTSGGLLISVPYNKVNKLLTKLEHLGVSTASVIGEIVPLNDLSSFQIEVV